MTGLSEKKATAQEFQDEVTKVGADVVAALEKHSPTLPIVIEIMIGLLMGALYQIPEGKHRESMRETLHLAVDTPERDTYPADIAAYRKH